MAIAIQPYTEEWIPAVQAFNQRLAAGGIAPEFHFPDSNVPQWLPKVDGRRIYQEYFLATDGDAVRGGYILKFQDFSFRGEMRRIGFYRLPLSEGIVNKTYATVGIHLLRHAIKSQPLLFALGMGGFHNPLPQMLKAMGWSLQAVPFHFKVNHPAKFLRNIAPLRQSPARRLAADLAAFTGAGWLGIHAAQAIRSLGAGASAGHGVAKPIVAKPITAEPIPNFGDWADEIWQSCQSRYALLACRDRANLNILYPNDKNFIRLKVSRGSEVLGWAVLLDTQMRDNKYFGTMRLGSIADCLALPENASAVTQASTRFLQDQGVDLIVSNQTHAAWGAALRKSGFFPGPSNFIFASGKSLTELLSPQESTFTELHINRGDGDGPVNL
jgi:hypothetical protein